MCDYLLESVLPKWKVWHNDHAKYVKMKMQALFWNSNIS